MVSNHFIGQTTNKKLKEGGPKREKINNRTSKDEQIGDLGQGNQNPDPEIEPPTDTWCDGSCQATGVNYAVDWGKPHTTPRQVYKWQCKIIHEKAQSQTVTLFVFGINHQVGLYTENTILGFPESGLRVSGGGVWVD